MAKDFAAMEHSNPSTNPSIHDVSDPARRVVLRGGAAAAVAALLAPMAGCALPQSASKGPTLGFKGIPPGIGDKLVVPDGYVATRPSPPGASRSAFPATCRRSSFDASNSAAEQAVQMGMHHDGVEYFPLAGSSSHGLIAINHEYTDDGLLHVGGFSNMNAEKVRKAQNAHGLSVYEVQRKGDAGRWCARRVTRGASRWTRRSRCRARPPAIR
jgi:secreted PhoX family phosphatase